jgi:hypothetical protein
LRAEGFSVVVPRTRDSLVGRLGPTDFAGPFLSAQGVRDETQRR